MFASRIGRLFVRTCIIQGVPTMDANFAYFERVARDLGLSIDYVGMRLDGQSLLVSNPRTKRNVSIIPQRIGGGTIIADAYETWHGTKRQPERFLWTNDVVR